MNKKLILSLAVICSMSFSGCAVVTTMFTDQDEYREIAARALELPQSRLKVDKLSIQSGLSSVKYNLTDIETNDLYRCSYKTGITGGASDVSCQKRNAEGYWEDAGIQPPKDYADDAENDADREWFHFGNPHDSDAQQRAAYMSGKFRPEKSTRRVRGGKAGKINLGESAAPTTVITSQDIDAIARENTKLYNGQFKVRDEQGHSYQCNFASVGQTQSDNVAVCQKLY